MPISPDSRPRREATASRVGSTRGTLGREHDDTVHAYGGEHVTRHAIASAPLAPLEVGLDERVTNAALAVDVRSPLADICRAAILLTGLEGMVGLVVHGAEPDRAYGS